MQVGRHPGQVADIHKDLPREGDAQQQYGPLGEHISQHLRDAGAGAGRRVVAAVGPGRGVSCILQRITPAITIPQLPNTKNALRQPYAWPTVAANELATIPTYKAV